MNYYNRIYYTRFGIIVKNYLPLPYTIDFIENNTWVNCWSIPSRVGQGRGERRRPGKARRSWKRLGKLDQVRAVARKVCPRSDSEFSNFFSRWFFQDFQIFFRRLRTYHSRMVIYPIHRSYYSLLLDQVLRIPKFFPGAAKKDYDASFGSWSLVQWIICHVPSWCSTRAVQDSTQSPSFI